MPMLHAANVTTAGWVLSARTRMGAIPSQWHGIASCVVRPRSPNLINLNVDFVSPSCIMPTGVWTWTHAFTALVRKAVVAESDVVGKDACGWWPVIDIQSMPSGS